MSENSVDTGPVKNVTTYQNNDMSRKSNDIYYNIYKFCTDAYYGEGGFLDGTYLVPHTKETDMSGRYLISTYKNYIQGIINSLLNPVFSTSALRASNNTIFDSFIENVDNKGNGIQKFNHNVTKFTILHGVTFVVMDNVSNIPDTQVEVIKQRAYPYMYQVTADRVLSYGLDKQSKLNSLTFTNGINEDGEVVVTKVTDKYIVSGINSDGFKQTGTKKYHKLGVIPVISMYDSLSEDVLPMSPTYDLCRLNWTIYNQDSEQRVIERNSAFCMLTLDNGGDENDINLNIGSDSLLTYGSRDKTVNKPEWISPEAAILQNMMEASNNSVNKLIEVAANLGVHIASMSTTSAKHEAAKFIGSQYAIKHTARLAEEFEQMVSELFGIWINTVIEYAVKYPDAYTPAEIEITEKIKNYKELLTLDLDSATKNKLQKHISDDILNLYDISED